MTSPDTALPGVHIAFDNTYARLPERFFARQAPAPVSRPRLIKLNAAVAKELGLDVQALASEEGVEILAGNRIAVGSDPLAQAYAGHQFGHFVPTLGDGRAILLGEVIGTDGHRYDFQLKGSGITPFSRRGDGRAALGPVLREYIVSEAMAALGVPTTRALAAVATGDAVYRETVLPGAVLTRVAASHLRVGTFEYFAARGDTDAIRTLADYAIARHYPERHYPDAANGAQRYRAFLDGVVGRQAHLIAQWMMLGFIHGVMNTDNCSISGETIDFGPCAFMEAYSAYTVFSSIDSQGRYAYGNQPRIALWNLSRLAEALMPLLQEESGSQEAGMAGATQALEAFPPQYSAAFLSGLRAKLGLYTEAEGDVQLAQELLDAMAAGEADFTLTFRRLADAAAGPEHDSGVRAQFKDPARFDAWAESWRARTSLEDVAAEERARRMRAVNPIYIPRNHLVEQAISAAAERQDFGVFEELLAVIAAPFEERVGLERFAIPAKPEERVLQTFCGT
jgi:uncharacterized protein YdiU (UPF0061 family)